MLRSRLELAERDGETARRRLEATRLEREREARARDGAFPAGTGFRVQGVNGSNAAAAAPAATANGRGSTRPAGVDEGLAAGPAPMEVSNAAALQEARAELARLRARVAFKD